MSIDQGLTAERARLPSKSAAAGGRLDARALGAIFAGGVAGTLLRVWLGRQFAAGPAQWPWATFAINISGAFALGYLATRLQERLPQSTYRRPVLATSFCGAYTTFSTMQLEALGMIEHHHDGLAAGYALASICAGYLAVWVATAIVRRTRRLR